MSDATVVFKFTSELHAKNFAYWFERYGDDQYETDVNNLALYATDIWTMVTESDDGDLVFDVHVGD